MAAWFVYNFAFLHWTSHKWPAIALGYVRFITKTNPNTTHNADDLVDNFQVTDTHDEACQATQSAHLTIGGWVSLMLQG